MIATSKTVVLCNNRIAIPALQTLHSQGRLCAMGVPENNTDVIDFCKILSEKSGIPLLVFTKESFEIDIEKLIETYDVHYIFTMTFPWKISSDLLKKHPNKFYNFHYGLLPEMGGADPIFESIRSQAKETGISVHFINNKIDKGNIIIKKTLPLNMSMTHGTLCSNLAWLGSNLLADLFNSLQKNYTGIEQDEKRSKYYKKPDISDVCISWQRDDATAIEALTRACNPWNKGAYTQWNGWNIRVVEATVVEDFTELKQPPGTVISIDPNKGLIVKCNNDSFLRLDIVYTDEGFMSGYKLSSFGIKKGIRFTSI